MYTYIYTHIYTDCSDKIAKLNVLDDLTSRQHIRPLAYPNESTSWVSTVANAFRPKQR